MPSNPTNNEAITTSNISAFDPTSIVVGKRLSAFAPYQRQEPNSTNPGMSFLEFPMTDAKSVFDISMMITIDVV